MDVPLVMVISPKCNYETEYIKFKAGMQNKQI